MFRISKSMKQGIAAAAVFVAVWSPGRDGRQAGFIRHMRRRGAHRASGPASSAQTGTGP